MKYENYSSEDFMMDPQFQRWVQHNDNDTALFWRQFLEEHPEKVEEVEQAKSLVLLTNFQDHLPTVSEQDEVWQRIQQSRQQGGVVRQLQPGTQKKPWHAWAAVIALLVTVGIGFYVHKLNQAATYVTEYGQPHAILLKDGTQVLLNANSTLKVLPNWGWGESREVELKGEAFFKVVKKTGPGDKRFVVHTQALAIEVLGTQFNVFNRQRATQVVLSTGKVKIRPNQQEEGSSVIMKPGELVQLTQKSGKLLKKTVDPVLYTDWIRKQWVLDNTTLLEVTNRLEETFGLKASFAKQDIAMERMSGVVSTEDLDELLDALAIINKIKVKRENNTIYFSR